MADARRTVGRNAAWDIVCTVRGIADIDASPFFNNIARRLLKKRLRVAANGFTTQH